jgi:hypothetical protein
MAETGRTTINEVDLVEVNSDPSIAPGIVAPLGSLALLSPEGVGGTAYALFQKTSNTVATAWARLNPNRRAGLVDAVVFAGNPKVAAVTFTAPFPDENYSVVVTGSDGRMWSVTAKTAAGFTINSNANQAPTGPVSWLATYQGEAG